MTFDKTSGNGSSEVLVTIGVNTSGSPILFSLIVDSPLTDMIQIRLSQSDPLGVKINGII